VSRVEGQRSWRLACALGLFVAALVATVSAFATSSAACDPPGTPACGRQNLASWQLTLAVVGLVPAGLLVYAVASGRKRLALGALAAGVLCYLGWALLNDAAVHGWQHL
jgi:uncharacterized BrkB/YihY/UPF0761 family membrane protein